MEGRVSVVIVNWNGKAMLLRCLEALMRQSSPPWEVIVVDNGSTDGSVEALRASHPDVHLLCRPTNLGFAAANNLGIAAARGEWVALLNNDAFPSPDWLASLLEAARRHPEASGFASQQLQADDPTRLDGAGDAYHCFGLPWREGFGRPAGPPWDQARDIVAPCAAAAMYRREAVLAVGGFDERFFCYLEDVDLALRMGLAGHRFRYVPTAVVHHVGSGTLGRTSEFTRYHGHRNMVWCYVKNMPGPLFWRWLPGHLAVNVFSLVAFALRGEGRTLWRAKRDALASLPAVWRQRRDVQRRRVTGEAATALMVKGWLPLLRQLRSRA